MVFLVHSSLTVLLVILLSEVVMPLKVCALISVLLTFEIFCGEGLTLLWFICYELTLYPSVYYTYIHGYQVEKISACYWMMVMTGVFSFVFMIPMIWMHFSDLITDTTLSVYLSGVFVVKVPMYSLHMWLPRAHTEAPTTVSILLASLLTKVGLVGVIHTYMYLSDSWVMNVTLSCYMGVVVGSSMASYSSETKVLIAYSSVSHMNLVLLSVVDNSTDLMGSGLLVAMGHSYTSALTFFNVGGVSHKINSRILFFNSGYSSLGMYLSMLLVLNMLSNSGTPPSLSFMGELSYMGAYWYGLGAALVPVGIYFLFAFYYSIYFMMHLLKVGNKMGTRMGGITVGVMMNIISYLFVSVCI